MALLDNRPLRTLLEDIVQFSRIDDALAKGELEGIGVTAMNYTNGRSTFYQGQAHIAPWTGPTVAASPASWMSTT